MASPGGSRLLLLRIIRCPPSPQDIFCLPRSPKTCCPPKLLATNCPPSILRTCCPPRLLATNCPPSIQSNCCPPSLLVTCCLPSLCRPLFLWRLLCCPPLFPTRRWCLSTCPGSRPVTNCLSTSTTSGSSSTGNLSSLSQPTLLTLYLPGRSVCTTRPRSPASSLRRGRLPSSGPSTRPPPLPEVFSPPTSGARRVRLITTQPTWWRRNSVGTLWRWCRTSSWIRCWPISGRAPWSSMIKLLIWSVPCMFMNFTV